jgi:hypothetical protein
VNEDRVEVLVRRLLAAFPADYNRTETAHLIAEKLEPWDDALATEAVEWLVEHGRGLPRIAELRDAYAAAGGDLYDPGRNMSPARRPVRELTLAERAEVREIQRTIRSRLRDWGDRLTRTLGSGSVRGGTTEGDHP